MLKGTVLNPHTNPGLILPKYIVFYYTDRTTWEETAQCM